MLGLQRIRHSRLRPSPPFLQRFAIIPRTPLRVVCSAWGRSSVVFAVTFPTVAPSAPSAFSKSAFFPSSSRSSVARAPLLPRSRIRGALRPAFPQAPSVLPASFLPPSLRSLSPERPHSPPRRRSSLTPRAPFATRSPHALIPAFSGAPHRARPPLPQFSPSLPLSLPGGISFLRYLQM